MRHLFKSLFMTLVVTVGAVIALVVLLNHSFFASGALLSAR